MGLFGNLGGAVGQLFGGDKGGRIGGGVGNVGDALGAFAGFKNGGKVKRSGLAKVHKNEFVLPASVKPTKAQKAKVAKLHAKDKKKKGKK